MKIVFIMIYVSLLVNSNQGHLNSWSQNNPSIYGVLKSYSQPILCEDWLWTTKLTIFRESYNRYFSEFVEVVVCPFNIAVTSDAIFEENLFLTRRNIVTCHIRCYLWGEFVLGSTDICLGPEGGPGGLCGRWLRKKYFFGNIDHLERQYCF